MAAEPGVISAKYVGYDGQYDIYQQISQGTTLPPHKYKHIAGNTFGTADTGAYAARCYNITAGTKYGYINMSEIPTDYCGYLWYVNRPTLQWPTSTGALTQCWGNNQTAGITITNPSWGGGGGHPGIDIGVPVGTEVMAVDNGTVVGVNDIGQSAGYGKFLVVQLDNGLYAGYAHLNDFNDIYGNPKHVGDKVYKGWVIGHSGNTGGSQAPHLHFLISNSPISSFKNFDGSNLNPLNYFTDNGGHWVGQCVRT